MFFVMLWPNNIGLLKSESLIAERNEEAMMQKIVIFISYKNYQKDPLCISADRHWNPGGGGGGEGGCFFETAEATTLNMGRANTAYKKDILLLFA